jgi:hypothetical protein
VYPEDTPLTNLQLTLLHKMGVPAERLGDSTGQFAELAGSRSSPAIIGSDAPPLPRARRRTARRRGVDVRPARAIDTRHTLQRHHDRSASSPSATSTAPTIRSSRFCGLPA